MKSVHARVRKCLRSVHACHCPCVHVRARVLQGNTQDLSSYLTSKSSVVCDQKRNFGAKGCVWGGVGGGGAGSARGEVLIRGKLKQHIACTHTHTHISRQTLTQTGIKSNLPRHNSREHAHTRTHTHTHIHTHTLTHTHRKLALAQHDNTMEDSSRKKVVSASPHSPPPFPNQHFECILEGFHVENIEMFTLLPFALTVCVLRVCMCVYVRVSVCV
jgi:hypothetical protein